MGAELVTEFERRGFAVHGFTRAELDASNAEAVEAAFASVNPGVVLNAAAYNLVDKAESEPEEAFRGNTYLPRLLAMACRARGAKLVHYSTDYVFDGELRRPYVETDATHPLGAYGVSKLAGEMMAQAYLDDALVLRLAVVFGPGGRHTARGNFIEAMLKRAAAGQRFPIVCDQTVTPTYVPAVAVRTAELLDAGATGVFHCGGEQPITFEDYAKLIFRTAGVSAEMDPIPLASLKVAARRPVYSALANERMNKMGLAKMPPLADCVSEYLRRRG